MVINFIFSVYLAFTTELKLVLLVEYSLKDLSTSSKDQITVPKVINDRLISALKRHVEIGYPQSSIEKFNNCFNFIKYLEQQRDIYNIHKQNHKDYYGVLFKTPILRIIFGGFEEEIKDYNYSK